MLPPLDRQGMLVGHRPLYRKLQKQKPPCAPALPLQRRLEHLTLQSASHMPIRR